MSAEKQSKGLWGGLKHAFAIPRERLTDQEREWLELIAQKTVERGMATPALMALEGARPLSYVGAHVVLFFKPIISLLFPPERCDEVAALLEKRLALETLAQRIEELDRQRL